MINRVSITSCLILAFAFGGYSQSDTSYNAMREMGVLVHTGKLIKIHGDYPENGISVAAEFDMAWQTRGKREWQVAHKYPEAGCALLVATYGNPDVLGYSVGAAPTWKRQWVKGRGTCAVKIGLGLAWFHNPYDPFENPLNKVIGSHVTAMALGWAGFSRPLGDQLSLQAGLSFSHWSNGHTAVPNIGANLVALGVGLSYGKSAASLTHREATHVAEENRSQLVVQGIIGGHEMPGTVRPVDGPFYLVYGGGLAWHFSKNSRGCWGVGLNGQYYSAFRNYILTEELFPANDAIRKAYNLVLFGTREWHFGHVAFFLEAGVNLYAPFIQAYNKVWNLPTSGWVHQWTANKIGYRYYFRPDRSWTPYVGVALKANGGTADFTEISFGFRLF